jgi:hypothetical protein
MIVSKDRFVEKLLYRAKNQGQLRKPGGVCVFVYMQGFGWR